jgi:hypothetical protein
MAFDLELLLFPVLSGRQRLGLDLCEALLTIARPQLPVFPPGARHLTEIVAVLSSIHLKPAAEYIQSGIIQRKIYERTIVDLPRQRAVVERNCRFAL